MSEKIGKKVELFDKRKGQIVGKDEEGRYLFIREGKKGITYIKEKHIKEISNESKGD